MLRYINFILFFIASLLYVVFFVLHPSGKITQEVLDLFPQNSDRQIIDIYNKFANSKYILVAIKGFESDKRNELEHFLNEVKKIPNIDDVLTKREATRELQEFIAQNYYYIASINENNFNALKNMDSKTMEKIILENLESLRQKVSEAMAKDFKDSIESKQLKDSKDFMESNLQKDSKNITESTLIKDSKNITESSINDTKNLQNLESINFKEILESSNFNPLDPLNIFSMPQSDNSSFIAKDYGYAALIEMKSIEQEKVKETLESFEKIAKNYPQIRYFSQNFMSVTNLNLILNEVTFLLTFASIIFVILYFVIIRIPFLTINTICTLIVANIIAIFAVSYIYPKVTIMALTFGMGISNIAIDYMMHHNFFGLYVRNLSEKNKKLIFNKPVFYGYITTIIGFLACLFIPFPLLTQLSVYAIISLSFCYISFAFIYPKIGFSAPRLFLKMANLRYPFIHSGVFLLLSLALFTFSLLNLRLDFDLSKLDYQNKPMLKERDFFAKAMSENEAQILLYSDSLDGLISLSKGVQDRINVAEESKKFILPLALMPERRQIAANTAFLESKEMGEIKEKLESILPSLRVKIEKEIKKIPQLQDNAEDFVDNIFENFESSYEISQVPELNLESINNLGFDVILDSKISNDSSEKLENLESKSYYYLANIPVKYLSVVENFSKELESANPLQNGVESVASSANGVESVSITQMEGENNEYRTNGGELVVASSANERENSEYHAKGEENNPKDSNIQKVSNQNIDTPLMTNQDSKNHNNIDSKLINNQTIESKNIDTSPNMIKTQDSKNPNNIKSKITESKTNDHIITRSLQSFMDNITDSIYTPMLVILGIALSLMICMVLITCKGSFVSSVVFILFPLSSALSVVATHSELNIMHLFALLILVVVSIDYGIYSITEGDNPRTAHAIFFSTITTGISFGILIISKTKALNSFGEVIFTGMLCVLFMLTFHKLTPKIRKSNVESKS